MGNMRFKVGDRVRIKSLDWYNENKDEDGDVPCNCNVLFLVKNKKYLGTIQTVETVYICEGQYVGNCIYKLKGIENTDWTDEMIEGLVEEETEDKLKLDNTKTVREYWSEYARIYIEIYEDEPNECVLTHLYTLEGHRQKGYGRKALIEAESIAKELGCHTTYLKVETDSWMHEWYLRMGYKWYKNANKEYTWLVKNLTSIEKKKKEYPKTYEECRDLIEGSHVEPFCADLVATGYLSKLMERFARIIMCRDAYWLIAGKEMGLSEPWKPDWKNGCYVIFTNGDGLIERDIQFGINAILAFPTEEMRDAFKENFKSEIERCKELL